MLSRTVALSLPPRYHCSFPLSKVQANLLNKLGDPHTYIIGEVLTYAINLPHASRGNTDVFKLIPISIALENKEFPYIATEGSILCLHQTRQ
jgi:hypothetical protein